MTWRCGFRTPYHFFKITLITHSPNSLTFRKYISSKFEEKNISTFCWGTPLRPPWKGRDLFFKNWTKDFWKWLYICIAELFYTKKMRMYWKKIRVQTVKIYFKSYELFCSDRIFSKFSIPNSIMQHDLLIFFHQNVFCML